MPRMFGIFVWHDYSLVSRVLRVSLLFHCWSPKLPMTSQREIVRRPTHKVFTAYRFIDFDFVYDYRIRGILGSIISLCNNGGILIGFLVGHHFDYRMVPRILLIAPALFLASFWIFPESPYFLVKQNKFKVCLGPIHIFPSIRHIDSW